jgi:hypothetical protein
VPPKKLLITSFTPLSKLELELEKGRGSAHVIQIDPNGKTYELQFVLTPPSAAGPLEVDIGLLPSAIDGTKLPRVELPVIGYVHDVVVAVPSYVVLGARKLGDCAEAEVMLQSVTGEPFQIADIVSSEPGLVAKARDNQRVDDTRTIQFTQLITKRGNRSFSLRIDVRTHDNRVVTLPIDVSYFGIEGG